MHLMSDMRKALQGGITTAASWATAVRSRCSLFLITLFRRLTVHTSFGAVSSKLCRPAAAFLSVTSIRWGGLGLP